MVSPPAQQPEAAGTPRIAVIEFALIVAFIAAVALLIFMFVTGSIGSVPGSGPFCHDAGTITLGLCEVHSGTNNVLNLTSGQYCRFHGRPDSLFRIVSTEECVR